MNEGYYVWMASAQNSHGLGGENKLLGQQRASLTPNCPLGLVICVAWDENLLSERAAGKQCLRRQTGFMSKKGRYMFKKRG